MRQQNEKGILNLIISKVQISILEISFYMKINHVHIQTYLNITVQETHTNIIWGSFVISIS